jgi:hypothetical protein
VTKSGSNFYLDRDCIFKPIKRFLSQNGQRGSLLVCNWPHSVGQNHFFVKMLFNRDFAIQKCLQKRSSIRQVSQFKSRRLDASHHGSDARASDMEIACVRSAVRTTIL